jgi:hypothetical protein
MVDKRRPAYVAAAWPLNSPMRGARQWVLGQLMVGQLRCRDPVTGSRGPNRCNMYLRVRCDFRWPLPWLLEALRESGRTNRQ